MEAAIGFEPMNEGFADLCLSHLATPPVFVSCELRVGSWEFKSGREFGVAVHYSELRTPNSELAKNMERVAGFEPVTPTLARLCSTS